MSATKNTDARVAQLERAYSDASLENVAALAAEKGEK